MHAIYSTRLPLSFLVCVEKIRETVEEAISLYTLVHHMYLPLPCLALAGVVGSKVTVSDGCVLGAACEIVATETVPPNTIIYGSDCRRYSKENPVQVS